MPSLLWFTLHAWISHGVVCCVVRACLFSCGASIALSVLLNTARCELSSKAICHAAEVVDVPLDIMQMFRDNMALFTPALCLFKQVRPVQAHSRARTQRAGCDATGPFSTTLILLVCVCVP